MRTSLLDSVLRIATVSSVYIASKQGPPIQSAELGVSAANLLGEVCWHDGLYCLHYRPKLVVKHGNH